MSIPTTLNFSVSPVTRANTKLRTTHLVDAIHRLLAAADKRIDKPSKKQKKIEACGSSQTHLVSVSYHPLLMAARFAYTRHYPLVLSPDLIWLCITQGLASHIHLHVEELRHCFVQHEGKQTITVQHDGLVRGDPNSPWTEVFPLFSEQIRNYIGNEQHRLIIADFSTTNNIARAVSEITLMDAMSCYFNYECLTLGINLSDKRPRYGIPEIQLEGTLADWQAIRDRVTKFDDFETFDELEYCTLWIQALILVLDQFIAVYQGQIDQSFWQFLYKVDSESDDPKVAGWISVLFPYLMNMENGQFDRFNPDMLSWVKNRRVGSSSMDDFPLGLSVAPFKWNDLGTGYKMEFTGGFVGISQHPETLALRPELGWAVIDANC